MMVFQRRCEENKRITVQLTGIIDFAVNIVSGC
jgi:hypothetical protein